MSLVYDFLARLAFAVTFLGVRLPAFREHEGRLGHLPTELLEKVRGRRVLWIHNASVGELRAALPLVRRLRARHPGDAIVLSATSLAGRDLAGRVAEADGSFLLPLDAPAAVGRVIDALRPAVFVFTETEIWPVLLRELGRRGVPAVLVSGRISMRSFPRYRRIAAVLRDAFVHVRRFGMQSDGDAERIRALGAPAERVVVTGSLKLDAVETEASLRVEGDAPVWMAGSTHPGEETVCLEAFARLRARFPDLRLLLAPRHLDRLSDVERELARSGFAWTRRSRLDGVWGAAPELLLLDTLGELAGLWRFAAVAFVGGSIAPVGGHNLLEPARAGVPVTFGPRVENVAAAARALVTSGGGREVASAKDLEHAIGEWLADPVARTAAGRAAAQAVPADEVTERSLAALAPWLPGEAA